MLDKVLVDTRSNGIYTFAFSNGKLVFVLKDELGLTGEAIFRARVIRTNHANRSVFIEYIPGECGYVNLPVGVAVQDGSFIPVQLTWLGDGIKQAKFRYGWQLVGKYVVYSAAMPQQITSHKLPQKVQPTLQKLAKHYPGSWIVRSSVTSSEDITWLEQEMQALYPKINALEAMISIGQYDIGVPNYLKLLRSLKLSPDCEVVCNDHEINQQLLLKQNLWQIDAITLDCQLDTNQLLKNYLNLLKNSQVTLANGASLEINTVAGINIIDVNSDKLYISGNSLNFLVLDAIYEQICLRNLQGIILLDLIKNMRKSDEDKIVGYLDKLCKEDITHSKVLGFTRAGLCEIVRTKFS